MRYLPLAIFLLALPFSALAEDSTQKSDTGSGPTAKVYGTQRDAKEEKATCERATGKECIYDLCQEMMGTPPRKCTPGWKARY